MTAHMTLVNALCSTDELRQLYVTSPTFKAGVQAIAEVAESAVVGLTSVADERDQAIAQMIAAAKVAPIRKTF